MKMEALAILLASILLLASGVQALEKREGDVISIDESIEDDLFAAGGTIEINAPVDSVVIVGGEVSLNAPVDGAVVMGGEVEINAPIKGDLFVAGGEVAVKSDVGGKIVAAGGEVEIDGEVGRNLVAAGGEVRILSGSNIGRDAAIAAGDVYNAGNVGGTLWVTAENFQNEGTAGKVVLEEWEDREEAQKAQKAQMGASFFGILIALGFLIVGLIILRLFPGSVFAVDLEIKDSPVVKFLVGLGLIVGSLILVFVSALTVIGLPLAVLLMMLVLVGLLLANLFVAFSLGKWIGSVLGKEINDFLAFIAGYVILSILFAIPIAGGLIWLVSVSLGFGGTAYALNRSRGKTSERTGEMPPESKPGL